MKGIAALSTICLVSLAANGAGASLAVPEPEAAPVAARFELRHSKAKKLDLQQGDLVTVDENKGRLIRIRTTNGKTKLKAVPIKEITNGIWDLSIGGTGQVALAAGDQVIIYDPATGDVTTMWDPDLFNTGVAWAFEGHVYFSDLGLSQDEGVRDGGIYRFYPDTETIDSLGGRWVNPSEIGVDSARNIWVRDFKGARRSVDDALYAITPKGYAREEGARLGAKLKKVYLRPGVQGAAHDDLDLWSALSPELGRVAIFVGDSGLLSLATNAALKKPKLYRSCEGIAIHGSANDASTGDIYLLADGPAGKGIYMLTFPDFDPRFANPGCDGLAKVTTAPKLKNAWSIALYGGDYVTRAAQ